MQVYCTLAHWFDRFVVGVVSCTVSPCAQDESEICSEK